MCVCDCVSVYLCVCVCLSVCEKVCQWISYEQVDKRKLWCRLQLVSDEGHSLAGTVGPIIPQIGRGADFYSSLNRNISKKI